MSNYDLVVIGAGSGGVRAARLAAQGGARVAICEASALGGTCVNVGCVPKKLFVYGSRFAHEAQDAAGYGWRVPETHFDWPTLLANKDTAIGRLNDIYQGLLEDAGVELIVGRATLAGPNLVRVGDRALQTKRILVATGARPATPEIPGVEHGLVSDDMFTLSELPASLVIVGGGYIGVEFACIMNALGVAVTQLHRGQALLRGFDTDIQDAVLANNRAWGIDVRLGACPTAVDKTKTGVSVALGDGTSIEADGVLFATGRRPNVDGLGLQELGVELSDRGAIKIDAHYRSNVPSVFALGDVTDRFQLTPVAIREAIAFVKTHFEDTPVTLNYENIATAVFSQPPVGTVGLSEAEARDKHGTIDVYRSAFSPLKTMLTAHKTKAMLKVIVDRKSDRVVGCHMVGPYAAEIVQGLAVAVVSGATKAQFDATMAIHPTIAEEFVTMKQPIVDH